MPYRVLVVDDDEATREAICEGLIMEGYEAQSAANGREALDILTRYPAQLVLLDLLMPLMGGAECVAAIRERGLSVPIVLMSAVNDIIHASAKLAVDGTLDKPFSLVKLLATVQEYQLASEPAVSYQ